MPIKKKHTSPTIARLTKSESTNSSFSKLQTCQATTVFTFPTHALTCYTRSIFHRTAVQVLSKPFLTKPRSVTAIIPSSIICSARITTALSLQRRLYSNEVEQGERSVEGKLAKAYPSVIADFA